MWKTMVLPLFNALLMLTSFEKAKNQKQSLFRLLIGTFKSFLMIPKNTSTDLIIEMMGLDFNGMCRANLENSQEKWEARMERRPPEITRRWKINNFMKGIPNNWCSILKQQCSLCISCKKGIRKKFQIRFYHNVQIRNYKTIWADIKSYHMDLIQKTKKKNTSQRTRFLKFWKPHLKSLFDETETKFNNVYKDVYFHKKRIT